MSKRNKHRHTELPKPEAFDKSGITATFSERVGVPMKNVNELMNYIIFGDPKIRFDYSDNSF